MTAEARREIGELLAEQLPGYDDAVDSLRNELADRGLLDDDPSSQLRRARALVARLWSELAAVEDERDALALRVEKAENTPCWRCGGTA